MICRRAVIFAGGRGTRLLGPGALRPKPMVEVGDRPMLQHIIDLFTSAGVEEVIVAVGYLGEQVKRYFVDQATLSGDLSVDLATCEIQHRPPSATPCRITCVDTGRDAQTGARLKRVASYLPAGEPFFLTYGDGLCDVDLLALSAFHEDHGRQVSVTAVHPPARFGELSLDGSAVVGFAEKPLVREGWINGGFFVVNPELLETIADGDAAVFEDDVLTDLATKDQLRAFRHEGFWQCMDTPRDVAVLQRLWEQGPPWRRTGS